MTAQRLKGAAIGFAVAGLILVGDRCIAGFVQCGAAGSCPW